MPHHFKDLIDNIKYYYNIPKAGEKEVGALLTPKRESYPRKFYDNMSNEYSIINL